MDIVWFLQDFQMREGGVFNLSNYSVSAGNAISLRRHNGKSSVAANQKQMLVNGAASAVMSALRWNAGGEREREGKPERREEIKQKNSLTQMRELIKSFLERNSTPP